VAFGLLGGASPAAEALGLACCPPNLERVTAEREAEIPLTGGWVTSGVVRVGDTVRRPPAPNAALVHRILAHLEEIGFESTPRFLGFDAQGREVLTFIEGDVPSDCRANVWEDGQLEAAAKLLRRFHDATAELGLAGEAEVICHHDFGPWNLIWRDGFPVAVIDFDDAAPGSRLDDLGYAIWKHLNLGLIDLPTTEQHRRLRLMAAAYDVPADEGIVQAIAEAQERMRRLIETAPRGVERDNALDQNRREREWLRQNRRVLVG
jgi:hypothetical protein